MTLQQVINYVEKYSSGAYTATDTTAWCNELTALIYADISIPQVEWDGSLSPADTLPVMDAYADVYYSYCTMKMCLWERDADGYNQFHAIVEHKLLVYANYLRRHHAGKVDSRLYNWI